MSMNLVRRHMPKLRLRDIIIYGALVLLFIWIMLKILGIIKSPALFDVFPYIMIGVSIGVYVATMNRDIAGIKEKIIDIQNNVKDINKNVSALDKQITRLEERIKS